MSATQRTSTGLSAAEATDLHFWRALCPTLTVEGSAPVLPAALANADLWLERLREEGYVNDRDVIHPSSVGLLRAGIQTLVDRGIPPAFAFVYDEFWLVFRSLDPFLQSVLGPGYRVLPDCWAWYVKPSNEAAGWKPHRDRPGSSLDAQNTPNSLTVWLPLTDATPLNGCIHVIPAHWDEAIGDPVAAEPKEFRLANRKLQDVRALPAPAGSLLAWNQLVLHWGGRASPRAAGPRCSIALQFQRGDMAPLTTPLLDPHALLPFRSRLGLIGRLIRGYSYFQTVDTPEMKGLAAALDWRFWHEGSAAAEKPAS